MIVSKIEKFYKQIKNNEIAPKLIIYLKNGYEIKQRENI